MIRKVLSPCLLSLLVFFVISTNAHEAIINGDLARLDQFPYQASIEFPNKGHVCDGGIIGEIFILTAAHCIIMHEGHISSKPMNVIVGTNDLSVANTRVSVKKVYVPKSYVPGMTGSIADIAVLKLVHQLTMSTPYIKKLELPKNNSETYIGETATIAGFGLNWIEIENNKVVKRSRIDNRLRYVETKVLGYYPVGRTKNPTPKEILIAKIKLHDSSKPRGTCAGDSGSPLVHRGTVIGVLNVGNKNCIENFTAGIYARVTYYLDFIHHAMRDKHHDSIITGNLLI